MTSRTTYKIRAYLSKEGYSRLDFILEQLCDLYNAALEERILAYKWRGKSITKYDQQKEITKLRGEDEFWNSLYRGIPITLIHKLDGAFKGFFRRVKNGEKPGFPRFKSNKRFNSIQIGELGKPIVIRGKWGFLTIKGLPTIRFKWRKDQPHDRPKFITIKKTPIGLYISLTYKIEKKPLSQSDKVVGIDLGVTDRLTLSTGQVIHSRVVDYYREKKLQRSYSRCKLGSNTRKKRVLTYARERYRNKIKNKGTCHEITSNLIKRFGKIFIEDLDIKSMTRKGDNSRSLNRRILEQSWGMLREQLSYKVEWTGRQLLSVPPYYTSQRCSRCRIIDSDSRQGKSYRCRSCGNWMDADYNAALNILRSGRELLGDVTSEIRSYAT